MIEFQYIREFTTPFEEHRDERIFFEAQEIFYGRTMCDLCLNDESYLQTVIDKY